MIVTKRVKGHALEVQQATGENFQGTKILRLH